MRMRDDTHDATGIHSHSQCDGLRTSALRSCQPNTPTGHPVDPKADEDSNDRHDHQEGGRGSKNGGSSYGGQGGTPPRRQTARRSGGQSPGSRRHHGPVGRRLNPPEKDPSSRTPYHSNQRRSAHPEPRTTDRRRSPAERRQPGRSNPADRPPRDHSRTSTPPPAAPCQPASPAADHDVSGPSRTHRHPPTRTGPQRHKSTPETGRKILNNARKRLTS